MFRGIIALYSPPRSLELFYLCKVLEKGVAIEDIVDNNNYDNIIPKGHI